MLALASAGCVGTIGDDGAAPSSGSSGSGGPSPDPQASWPARYVGNPSGLRRLSRDELVTSMEMLVGKAPLRADFPADARSGIGPLRMTGVPFVGNELPKLELVVQDFSNQVAPNVLAKTACAATDQAQRDCLGAWATGFAIEALRRPLRAGESDALKGLVASADGTVAADTTAVATVLRTVFFSPSFLYRAELGTTVSGKPTLGALTSIEIAQRLSFLTTLGPPDATLTNAATSGALSDPEARVGELMRLLKTDRGKRAIAVFVLEWLGSNEPTLHIKSAKYLAGLDASFESDVRASADKTIADALFGGGAPTVARLLSSSSYLTDPAIASITKPAGSGLNATGDTAATGREGLLMHPQVLGAHTKEDGVSPFQLGRFLRESVLCEVVAPPPANATQMALPDLPPGASLRDNFQHKVSASPTCLACHAQFAPLGYSLLPFDPVGRWFQKDPSGKPWDLSGSIETFSGTLSFSTTKDMVEKLGARSQVHGCFAQGAIEWTFGRGLVDEDKGLVGALDKIVRSSNGDVLEIFQALVRAPEFVTFVRAR